jgi:predicted amino acid racemase
MFLKSALNNNPELIEAASYFHEKQIIPPNTYCIDLDTVRRNALLISEKAKEYSVELYFMTKQFGRNPLVAQAIVDSGIEKAVAVDIDEARVLHKNHIKLGHIGHLVQMPTSEIKEALEMKPEVITCFCLDKILQVNRVAEEMNVTQDILLRVVDNRSFVYPGQEGGVRLEQLEDIVQKTKALKGVQIIGVTSFPCFLYNEQSCAIEATSNINVLMDAVRILENQGIHVKQINTPSATCVSSIPLLSSLGGTHGEPGHALTGTTPLHASGKEPENVGMIYVTEVSHRNGAEAFVFGGGFYSRSHVSSAYSPRLKKTFKAVELPPEHIDYYGSVIDPDNVLQVGDTLIYAFRTQVFVTRANVAVLEGVQEGKPRILGIFDSHGRKIE